MKDVATACGPAMVISTMLLPLTAHAQDDSFGEALIIGATLTIAGTGVFDIATASRSASRYNAQHSLGVIPILNPIERRVGVAFRMPIPLHVTSGPSHEDQTPTYRPPVIDRRSPATATMWSLASTALPIAFGALVGSGPFIVWRDHRITRVLVGPSVGHWYSSRVGRGWTTIVVRVVMMVVGVAGVTSLDHYRD